MYVSRFSHSSLPSFLLSFLPSFLPSCPFTMCLPLSSFHPALSTSYFASSNGRFILFLRIPSADRCCRIVEKVSALSTCSTSCGRVRVTFTKVCQNGNTTREESVRSYLLASVSVNRLCAFTLNLNIETMKSNILSSEFIKLLLIDFFLYIQV